MKNPESNLIDKNLEKILIGTIGAGLFGEALYYAITGDTLPSGALTGLYRGFLEVGPAVTVVVPRLFQYFMRNRTESNE